MRHIDARERDIGSPVGEHYTRLSGTSMAAPHVAGAAPLLLQQHPTWSGAQLQAALMSSAHPNDTLTVYQQGAGRLDVGRATAQLLTAEPASLSFGITSYPHHDDVPLVRTVRYHNAGAAPVTLTLAAGLRRGAIAAPAAMISVAPAELTIAAGATAEAQLTIDTSVEAPDGLYGGALIATSDAASGGARLVTPLGVEREVESADLTVRVLGTTGQPGEAFVSLKGVAALGTPVGDTWVTNTLVTGQAVLRVPVGTYVVDSFDEASQSWLPSPRTHVPDATTLVMDNRLAAASSAPPARRPRASPTPASKRPSMTAPPGTASR